MDERVGNEFSNGQVGEHRQRPSQGLLDYFVRGHERHDVVDNSFESNRIAANAFLLSQCVYPALTPILYDAHGFALQIREVAEVPGEKQWRPRSLCRSRPLRRGR